MQAKEAEKQTKEAEVKFQDVAQQTETAKKKEQEKVFACDGVLMYAYEEGKRLIEQRWCPCCALTYILYA